MNLCSKFTTLGAALVLTTAFASADTFQIGSYASDSGGNLGNSNGVMTLVSGPGGTAPNTYQLNNVTPTWAAAIGGSVWVGIASTAGPSGTVNPAKGTYFITTDLGSNLVGYSGSIGVLADDTTSVWLNGVELQPANLGGGDGHCETGPGITCTKVFNVGLPGAASFLAGDNTLTFELLQAGTGATGGTGNPSGVDFEGTITNTPEPSTLLLLGTGLIGSAGALFRRMRA